MFFLQITAILIAVGFIGWAMAGKYLGFPPAMYGSIVMGISSITLALMSFQKGEFLEISEVGIKKYLLILALSSVNGLALYFFSMNMQKPTDVGIFSSSVSAYMVVLAPIIGYFLYAENISSNKIIGVCLIIAGVLTATQKIT